MSDNEKALIKTDDVPELSLEEFGRKQDIAAMGNRIRALMPGGEKLSPLQAMATAQYALTVGANPFRGEIYAYEDRGKLQIVEGYKLLVRWAKAKCDYSEWYDPMDPPREGDIGFWCRILRTDKHALLETLLKSGMDHEKAMDIVTTTAGGVVRAHETWSKKYKKPIDPPTGWTWEDVAKKRALKNALNKSHGVPSIQDLAEMSWRVNGHDTQPEDWATVTEDMTPNEAAAEAEYNAKQRERHEREPTVANAQEAIDDLYGDVEDNAPSTPEVVEGEIEDEVPMPHEWTAEESKELAAWWRNDVVISDKQALAYLEVSKISEYAGDIDAAKAQIKKAISEETDQ